MRIAYIANIRLPTEKAHGVQIMKMCEAFSQQGADVELIVPTRRNHIHEDPFDYYAIDRNFKVTTLHIPDTLNLGKLGFLFQHFFFSVRAALYARALRPRPDLVYSRDVIVLSMLGPLKKKAVWEVHNSSSSRLFIKVAVRMPCVVAISEGLRTWWSAQGIDKRRIIVAHDGVDLEEFAQPESKEAARMRLGLSMNDKIALYIGRLDGWKGVETLCEASNLLARDGVHVVLIGGEKEDIERLGKQYPHVTFLGYRPYRELQNNQQAADVLVLPNTGKHETSLRFTSPLKLFTYMASGVPIVSSSVPSIREVLDETCATLVPPDDPQALAAGIVRTLTDRQGGAERARCARERVATYAWRERARAILKATRDDAVVARFSVVP